MKGKINKLTMFMLALFMAISMFSVNVFAAKDCTADCKRVVEAYDLDDAEDYINDGNNSTYPTKEGYIFAGWYTKETCTEDSLWGEEEPGDTVYALFVPSHIISVKAQISGNLLDKDTSNDATASIRFVTTVDTLYYRQAGFEVSYVAPNGQKKTVTSASNKVYKKLYAIGSTSNEYTEEDVLEYTPEGTFCGLSAYFKACTVKNIGAEYFTTAFTVKPYVITMDGSKVYGETDVKSINDYFLAEDVWVSSTDANAADTVENGTEAKPFATLNYALGMVKNGGTVHVKDSYTAPSDFAWKDHDKMVTITGGTVDFTGVPKITIKEVDTPVLQINDAVTFTGTTLKFVDGQHIYANGNRVEIASNVTWGDSSAYVWIYGGAYKTTLKSDTNLVLAAGNYARVFGGGNFNDVTGDVNVTISGNVNTGINYKNHTLTYAAFGGGENGSDIEGDINFTIANDTVLFDYVYGGGYGSKVTGDITVNFSGKAMSVYGGGRNGYVTGNTELIMSGANAWVEQLFGGCQGSSMKGNASVYAKQGTVVRRIYGGCYNDSDSWSTGYHVIGHTMVNIDKNATISKSYGSDDSIISFSRTNSLFEEERGAFIFNDYTNNSNVNEIGRDWSASLAGIPSQSHNYIVRVAAGGTVYAEGAGLRVVPNSGKVATVRQGSTTGAVLSYFEGEGVCDLPVLNSVTSTQAIYVIFNDATPSDVDKSDYEAKVNGGYYETLEEAVDAAKVQATEDVVTVTLLKDAEVESTMIIDDDKNIKIEGASKYTINRADALVDGNIFDVKESSTLTVNNVVLDGRITSDLSKTNLDEITGSTASLIYNAGTVNLQNMTGQYAVKTEAHGAVLQSGGSTDIVTVDNSTFSHNKAAGQGAAIRMGGSTKELTVTNSTFEYNEVYTLTSTAEGGKVSVLFTGNGGAIGTHADVATIDNCSFVENKATGYSAKNDGSAGAVYSGTSSIVTMTGTNENALFDGNGVTNGHGGAVSAGSGKVTITGYTFTENTSTGNGGAIFSNGGSTKIKSVSCTFEGNIATGNGGVAYAGSSGTLIFDEDAECTVEALAENNKAGGNGGAIAQGGNTVVKVTGYQFESNTAKQGGAVRVNSDALSITVKNAEFVSNRTANLDGTDYAGLGGAIFNDTDSGTCTIVDTTFTTNTAKQGGAIYNQGVLTMTGTGSENALLDTNSSSDNGGAIYLNGTAVTITGYKFNGNTATGKNGGAICNYSNGSQVLDCQFTNNEAAQGGAIYCGGNTNTLTFGVTETPVQEAKFEGNESTGYGGAIGFGNGNLNVTGYDFTSNTSATYGGAIYTVGDNNTINITDVTFNNNSAKNGGAVCANGKNANTKITGSTFTSNSSTESAGAVYVANTTTTVTIDDSDLSTNSAVNGGAVYNKGTLTVTDSALKDNASTEYAGAIFIDESTVTVNNTSFTSNTSAEGGAIIVGRIEEIPATDTTEATTNYYAGTLHATDCTFTTNTTTGGNGGAILNISGSTANITDTTFTSNESKDAGGAIYNNGTLTLEGKGKGTALFNSNGIVNDANENGGAIYNGGTLNVTAYVFDSNTAYNGAAVCNYGKNPRFIDCQFINNAAEYIGGAIYNGGGQTIHLEVSKEPVLAARCEGNSAIRRGGAVGSGYGSNYIDGYEFKNNHAGYGGAVYVQNVLDANNKAAYTKISNSNFIDNYSEVTSIEASNNHGGALQVDGGKIDIETCEFNSNDAVKNGGAIYFSSKNITAIVKDTTLDENTAGADGGALRLVAGNTTIVNTDFSGNTAKGFGGAISASDTAVLAIRATSEELGVTTATKAIMQGNIATSSGGAVYINGSETLTVSGYTFDANETLNGQGGAIYRTNTALDITNAKFTGNIAKTDGGAIYGAGGGEVKLTGTDAAKAIVENNSATSGAGGAIRIGTGTLSIDGYKFTGNHAVNGGAIQHNNQSSAVISNSEFSENYATTNGGAISTRASHMQVSETNFTNNYTVDGNGGAIYLARNKLTLTSASGNAMFSENKAQGTDSVGGAIYVTPESGATCTLNGSGYEFNTNSSTTYGGAIYADTATLSMTGISFTENESTYGGAIHSYASTVTATSCEFTSNVSANAGTPTDGLGKGGGALNIVGNSDVTLNTADNVAGTFTSNATNNWGGAIYVTDSKLSVDGYNFTSNTAIHAAAILFDDDVELISEAVADDESTTDVDESADAVYDELCTEVITINNSVFTSNKATNAGGAMYLNKRTVKFTDCSFAGNGTTGSLKTGGVIHIASGVAEFVGNSTDKAIFQNNTTGSHGGAINNVGGTLKVSGYKFIGNTTTGYTTGGNTDNGFGGAINNSKTAIVTDCMFDGNTATGKGGAIYNGSGANLTITVSESPKVESVFKNNSSEVWGGAIGLGSGTMNIYGYQFLNNSAEYGGAISRQSNTLVTIQDSEHSIVDAVFKGNTATCAGAIYTTNGTTEITDYTFENNSATEGGAIYANGGTVKPTDCKFGGDESALGNKATTKNGGAIFINNGSTVTLISDDNASMAIFKNNESTLVGGAVYISKGTLNVTGYTFDSNKAKNTASDDGGGAIFNANNSNNKMDLENSVFNNNYAARNGGAICTHGPNPEITNCKFTNNTADKRGGAIYGGGSKVVTITGGNAEMAIFSGNNVTGNISTPTDSYGGAIGIGSGKVDIDQYKFDTNTAYQNGGAVYITGSNEVYSEITNSTFVNNSTTNNNGGAMYVNGTGRVTVENVDFDGNHAKNRGGAVCVEGGKADFTTCDFTNNDAKTEGGALRMASSGTVTLNGGKFENNDGGQGGGAIQFNTGTLKVTNYAFIGNTATAGSAIRMNNTGTTLTGCTLSESGISGTYTDGGGNTLLTEE